MRLTYWISIALRRMDAVSSSSGSVASVDTVDQDAPALRHIEPLNQFRQRRLARAGGADDADHLPGGDLQRNLLQGERRVGAIAEANCAPGGGSRHRPKGRYVSVVESVVDSGPTSNQKKNPNEIWSEWQDSNLRPLRPERK